MPIWPLSRLYSRHRRTLLRDAGGALDRKPGEEITHVVMGYVQPRRSMWNLVNLVPGAHGAHYRYYWLVTTNSRIVCMSLSGLVVKPTGINWQRPLAQVRVTRYRRGLMSQMFELQRWDGDTQQWERNVLRLRSPSWCRPDAAAVAAQLGGR